MEKRRVGPERKLFKSAIICAFTDLPLKQVSTKFKKQSQLHPYLEDLIRNSFHLTSTPHILTSMSMAVY